jgi:hypothetical protein
MASGAEQRPVNPSNVEETMMKNALAIGRSLGKLPFGTATEIVNQLEADGFVIVPKEPTIEMLRAMPTLPAISLPAVGRDKELTPGQVQNRARYLAALAAAYQ